jgi:protein phosphatase
VGVPVQCAQCGKRFTARSPASPPAEFPLVVSGTPPRLDLGSATSPGRVRTRNEDSFLLQSLTWSNLSERHDLALLAVADGMGGYEAGDRASALVIRTVGAALAPLFNGTLSGQFKGATATILTGALAAALQEANRSVYQKATGGDPACKGMGATAAVVLVWDGLTLIGHVGDCRVYHQRAGQLTQVTRDQTLVARMVELGQLTAKEALNHPARNEVSHAVGKTAELEPARYRLQLAAGDWLVVACDGLHAHVEASTLQEEINKAPPAAARLTQQLVELVNQRGGSDNCTILAARCY